MGKTETTLAKFALKLSDTGYSVRCHASGKALRDEFLRRRAVRDVGSGEQYYARFLARRRLLPLRPP